MVYLAQVLCPNRHAILAGAVEDPESPEALRLELALQMGQMRRTAGIDGWCGLCGAGEETWTVEVGVTRYVTMAEALPALRASAVEQAQTAALLQALGLAADGVEGEPPI